MGLHIVTKQKDQLTHFVSHKCCHSAASLMVVHVCLTGANQNKDEAYGHRRLQGRVQHHCLLQPHKHNCRLLQKLQGSWFKDKQRHDVQRYINT